MKDLLTEGAVAIIFVALLWYFILSVPILSAYLMGGFISLVVIGSTINRNL